MSKPLGFTARVTAAEKIKALRLALGKSHDKVAASGGPTRSEVSKIERGLNQLSTAQIREKLAAGLGVTTRDLVAYLAGQLTLENVLERRGQRIVVDDNAPAALASVLATAEAQRWSELTLGALQGAATASREPRTEEQWLILGRAYEMGALAAGRVIDDDPIEARRAAKKRNG